MFAAPERVSKSFPAYRTFPDSTRLTYERIGVEHGSRRTTALGDAQFVRAAQNGHAASLGVLLGRNHAALYARSCGFSSRSPRA